MAPATVVAFASRLHKFPLGLFFASFFQNLRDALDNMFDAKVPHLWGKVR